MTDIKQTPDASIRAPRRRIRWKRWLLGTFLSLLLIVIVLIGKELFARWQAQADLERAIAEVDRIDPRWRLEDIEADRREVPADRNSSLVVVAAHELLPKGWNARLEEELKDLRPDVALRTDQANRLSAHLKSAQRALRTARTLKDLPLGRARLHFSPDWFSTLMPHLDSARQIADLLHQDIRLLLHQKELAMAWSSNLAIVNTGRSLTGEAFLISALVRMGIDAHVVRSLERILAQGEVTRRELAERLRILQEESETALFVVGMRGERAGIHFMLSKIESGELELLRTVRGMGGQKNIDAGASWWDPVSDFFAFSMVLRSHATLLDFETNAIEAAKHPFQQRRQQLADLDQKFRAEVREDDKSLILARLLFPGILKVAEAEERTHTHLGTAAAALAAEQFRLQEGHWPDSLDELVKAGLLKEVPIDFFDGKPVRFRRAKDGIVIYSLGRDGRYDGKALDGSPESGINLEKLRDAGWRIEFRLWDPAHRRKPAPPAKPKE
jgi:hypothetical protein